MNRREKSWRCSKKSEISCEKCVENNQNITTMTLPCRCRGVIEWINCLLFDTLLLILEAAINLWMATKLGSYTEFFLKLKSFEFSFECIIFENSKIGQKIKISDKVHR